MSRYVLKEGKIMRELLNENFSSFKITSFPNWVPFQSEKSEKRCFDALIKLSENFVRDNKIKVIDFLNKIQTKRINGSVWITLSFNSEKNNYICAFDIDIYYNYASTDKIPNNNIIAKFTVTQYNKDTGEYKNQVIAKSSKSPIWINTEQGKIKNAYLDRFLKETKGNETEARVLFCLAELMKENLHF